MIARLAAMLAILAITVVTTVTSAHAARMSVSPGAEHATHVGGLMHSADIAEPVCAADRPCGSADADTCEFVCAALAAFLTSPGVDAARAPGAASHDFPSEADHAGRAPKLNERPPKPPLL